MQNADRRLVFSFRELAAWRTAFYTGRRRGTETEPPQEVICETKRRARLLDESEQLNACGTPFNPYFEAEARKRLKDASDDTICMSRRPFRSESSDEEDLAIELNCTQCGSRNCWKKPLVCRRERRLDVCFWLAEGILRPSLAGLDLLWAKEVPPGPTTEELLATAQTFDRHTGAKAESVSAAISARLRQEGSASTPADISAITGELRAAEASCDQLPGAAARSSASSAGPDSPKIHWTAQDEALRQEAKKAFQKTWEEWDGSWAPPPGLSPMVKPFPSKAPLPSWKETSDVPPGPPTMGWPPLNPTPVPPAPPVVVKRNAKTTPLEKDVYKPPPEGPRAPLPSPGAFAEPVYKAPPPEGLISQSEKCDRSAEAQDKLVVYPETRTTAPKSSMGLAVVANRETLSCEPSSTPVTDAASSSYLSAAGSESFTLTVLSDDDEFFDCEESCTAIVPRVA